MKLPALAAFLLLLVGCAQTPDRIVSGTAYDRSYFSGWIDTDGDCQNTRAEILAMTSQVTVTWSASGCTVRSGLWFDPYTGKAFTAASDIEIDHLVPLKWAWDRGASEWPRWKAERFALDPRNLVPVSRVANRDKGAQGPLEWMPPNSDVHCAYVTEFADVVGAYALAVSDVKAQRIAQLQARVCQSI